MTAGSPFTPRRHRWVRRRTEDGGRYRACARCGRDRNDQPSIGMDPGGISEISTPF